MKLAKKTLSVTLSLVLCGSLVAPAFAAVEFNKDQHVDVDTGALRVNDEGNYDYYLGGSVTLDKTLVIGEGVKANIDLKGHSLTGSGSDSVITITGEGASLTLDDTSEDGGGTVTGGTGKEDSSGRTYGGGAYVSNGGSLTINGGSISGNEADYGGGVYVYNGSSLTLDGGSISNNDATGYVTSKGGGVYASGSGAVLPGETPKQNEITIKEGSISGNTADWSGGGISASNTNITILGGSISDNEAKKAGGGGIDIISGDVYMRGGSISDNIASTNGGGVNVGSNGDLFVTDGTISGNTANNGGGIAVSGSSSISGGKYVYDYGKVMLNGLESSSSHIYGNTAATAGDDIQTNRLGYVYLKETDGWYLDAAGNRDSDVAASGTTIKPSQSLKSDYIPHEHTPGEVVYENEVPATCTEDGSYDAVIYCSGCGEKLSSTSETIEAKGHTHDNWEVTTPAQPGVEGEETEICPDCNEVLSTRPVEALPVDPEPVVPPVIDEIEIDDPDVPLAGLPMELAPEDKLTRGQLIAILHWMDGEPAAQLASFLDVLAESDYAEAIGWAEENGIAIGIGGNRFAPDEYVTRGQLVEFLNRFAGYIGSDLVLELDGDADEVLTWAMAEEIINDFFARLYA